MRVRTIRLLSVRLDSAALEKKKRLEESSKQHLREVEAEEKEEREAQLDADRLKVEADSEANEAKEAERAKQATEQSKKVTGTKKIEIKKKKRLNKQFHQHSN